MDQALALIHDRFSYLPTLLPSYSLRDVERCSGIIRDKKDLPINNLGRSFYLNPSVRTYSPLRLVAYS